MTSLVGDPDVRVRTTPYAAGAQPPTFGRGGRIRAADPRLLSAVESWAVGPSGDRTLAVATNITGERHDPADPDGNGLDGVLHALRALCPSVCAPSCCTWACSTVVGDVRRRRGAALVDVAVLELPDPELPDLEFPDLEFPDLEFEAVLVRRLAHRYLKVVADAQARRPVPRTWQLLLEPPPVRPPRLALAGVGTLIDYDLTLALVGACTVLGRTPGSRERDAHARVAEVLGTCLRELMRRTGDAVEQAAAGGLDGPAPRGAAWRRAEHLWTLRGRPAEAEAEAEALDRAVHAHTAHLLDLPR